jgi:methionine-S-sulfoxide reductase
MSLSAAVSERPLASAQGGAGASEQVDKVEERLLRHQGEAGVAIFAGGCFWCIEAPFELTEGVIEVISGYTGGAEVAPSYEEVSGGQTGHREAVWVRFDPERVTYKRLLEIFWRNIDPTQADGQFADIGPHYRTAIFFTSPEQEREARASREALSRSGRFRAPIVTELRPAVDFWRAEDYHQDYHRKKPAPYQRYKRGSGRAGFIERAWGDQGRK